MSPELDHIAFAVPAIETWRSSVEDGLGGVRAGGATGPGFRSEQWWLANAMRIELLEPHRPEEEPFLRRFLDSAGPGAHHLTFRVQDIEESVARVERVGFEVLYVRASDPSWQEAFLHPSVGLGTVIQLAAYPGKPEPPDLGSAVAPRAVLDTITLAVADRRRALQLFCDVLGGTPSGKDVLWPGRASIRLVDGAGQRADGIRGLTLRGVDAERVDLAVFGRTPAHLSDRMWLV